MRIAILGGTGDIGEGLALRWGRDTDYEIIVGSRDPEKAERRAAEYDERLGDHDAKPQFKGESNERAVVDADVVVLAVPPYHVSDTVGDVTESLEEDSVLVSPAVGMKREGDGFTYHSPPIGSVTELVAEAAPDAIPVVGAFHNLPAHRLSDLDAELGIDTVVVGDVADAKQVVMELGAAIDGLRALDGGGLANASEIEAVTPLLLNVAANNESMHDVGVAFD